MASSCIRATRLLAIDRANKRVMTKSGAEYEYDILILATGSSPFVPPIPGRDRPGVFVYRTIEDLEAITEAGKNSTRGVVIGGGLLGLEAAKALKDLGLATNVVEFAPRLMAVQVDEGGGGAAALAHRSAGRGRAHRQEHHAHRRRRNRASPHAFRRRRLARNRRHRDLGGHSPARRTGARLRPRRRRRAAASSSTATAAPRDESIYAIGECAAYRRPRVRSGGAGLPDGAHRRAHACSVPRARRSPAPT